MFPNLLKGLIEEVIADHLHLLTLAMQDPMNANICSGVMGIVASLINEVTTVSERAKMAKSHPEFLRAGIKFLTYKRTPQDFATMVNHLGQCRCDLSQTEMKQVHILGRQLKDLEYPTVLFNAVATVAEFIILSLSDLTQHKFRTGRAKNGEHPWPQGPEDLLPFGLKDSVAGLANWVARPPAGYTIFKLAGRLALFYVPFAKEVFQYEDFTFALAQPFQHLQAAIEFYNESDSSSSPLSRQKFFDRPVFSIFEFFNQLGMVDAPQYHHMMLMHGDWLKPIITPLLPIALTIPELAGLHLTIKHLDCYANAEPDPETGLIHIKFDRKEFAEYTQEPLKSTFTLMGEVRRSGCWNIQCPSQYEALHSRLCSGCGIIRFCGQKCQKDAWNAAELPHKALCEKIRPLKEAVGSENWRRLWTTNCPYAQFQDVCGKKAVDTGAVEHIGSTLLALMFRRSATFGDQIPIWLRRRE